MLKWVYVKKSLQRSPHNLTHEECSYDIITMGDLKGQANFLILSIKKLLALLLV